MAVDYGWWLQYALWSLDDAVLLLYGIAPKSKRATFLKKSLGSRTEPRGKRDREVYATYHKAQVAIDAKDLPYQFDNRGVEPHVFFAVGGGQGLSNARRIKRTQSAVEQENRGAACLGRV